jgi:hypothetical protein
VESRDDGQICPRYQPDFGWCHTRLDILNFHVHTRNVPGSLRVVCHGNGNPLAEVKIHLRFPISQRKPVHQDIQESLHLLKMGTTDPIVADTKDSSSSSSPERRSVNDTKGTEAYTTARAVEPSKSRIHTTFDSADDYGQYKPIPTYEGIHRWDPDFEWEPQEEKKLVRRTKFCTPSRDHLAAWAEWVTAR